MTQVSIVIPMYNEERYLPRCIDSLLKQSFSDFELIFTDDGSKDNSVNIVKNYMKKYPKIKIFKQNHKGLGAARNLGAKHSSGKIMLMIDSDMVFDKDYVANLIRPIQDGKVIGTSHGTELVANKENLWARSWSLNRIPNPPKYCGQFRAILTNKFFEAGGLDNSKGYFTDVLPKAGLAKVIKNAVCYHNNPETLKEAFKHSIWVGSSFFKKKEELPIYLKNYKYHLLSGLLIFFLILAFFFYYKPFSMLFLPLILVIAIFLGLESFALKRLIKEKDLAYLFSIPLLYIIRFSGYFIGFTKEFFKHINKR